MEAEALESVPPVYPAPPECTLADTDEEDHAPLFVLFPGPGIPALWAWHTPQGPSKAESVPPSRHSTAQMANHGLTPLLCLAFRCQSLLLYKNHVHSLSQAFDEFGSISRF